MFVRIIFISIVVLLFGSCSQKADAFLLKRRYNKGYHFHVSGKHQNAGGDAVSKSEHANVQEKTTPVNLMSKSVALETNSLPEPAITMYANTQNVLPFQKHTIKPLQDVQRYESKNNVRKLVKALRNNGCGYNPELTGFGGVFAVILFILLTIIYTFTIMSQNPDMVFGLAIALAALLAFLSLTTGIMIYT